MQEYKFKQRQRVYSDVEYGVRIGAQKDDWRTMLIYNYFDTTSYAGVGENNLIGVITQTLSGVPIVDNFTDF